MNDNLQRVPYVRVATQTSLVEGAPDLEALVEGVNKEIGGLPMEWKSRDTYLVLGERRPYSGTIVLTDDERAVIKKRNCFKHSDVDTTTDTSVFYRSGQYALRVDSDLREGVNSYTLTTYLPDFQQGHDALEDFLPAARRKLAQLLNALIQEQDDDQWDPDRDIKDVDGADLYRIVEFEDGE